MEDLRERVEAVERALTDGNGELTALAEGAASAERDVRSAGWPSPGPEGK